MTVRPLLALPALALLAACASDPAPRATPVVAAPPPPVAAPPPPAPMAGMDGRYTGVARLAAGSPRSCTVRTMNVSANAMGDQVMLMSGRNSMALTNTQMSDGMITGETMRGQCRYNVTLRRAMARQPVRRGGRAM